MSNSTKRRTQRIEKLIRELNEEKSIDFKNDFKKNECSLIRGPLPKLKATKLFETIVRAILSEKNVTFSKKNEICWINILEEIKLNRMTLFD